MIPQRKRVPPKITFTALAGKAAVKSLFEKSPWLLHPVKYEKETSHFPDT